MTNTKHIIANWKANKNISETVHWAREFSRLLEADKVLRERLEGDEIKVIICPPFPLISTLRDQLPNMKNLFIGAQDISNRSTGSLTGEVPGYSLSGIAKYVIIGHSERRVHYGETDEVIGQKITQAVENDLTPILCVRGESDTIHKNAHIVAYEDFERIGTGNNEDPNSVVELRQSLKLAQSAIFLYGASVTATNVHEYTSQEEIDGVIVGGASLDPINFHSLLKNV